MNLSEAKLSGVKVEAGLHISKIYPGVLESILPHSLLTMGQGNHFICDRDWKSYILMLGQAWRGVILSTYLSEISVPPQNGWKAAVLFLPLHEQGPAGKSCSLPDKPES